MDCSTVKCYGSDRDSYSCPHIHETSALTICLICSTPVMDINKIALKFNLKGVDAQISHGLSHRNTPLGRLGYLGALESVCLQCSAIM